MLSEFFKSDIQFFIKQKILYPKITKPNKMRLKPLSYPSGLTVFLIMLFLSSCVDDQEISNKISLSDPELEAMVSSDEDFKKFITVKTNEIKGLKSKLNYMSTESKIAFSAIYKNYYSGEDFIKNGTTQEKRFIQSIMQSNSSLYLAVVSQRIEKFDFNKEALMNLIVSKLNEARELKRSNQSSKIAVALSCEEIGMNAYVKQLNNLYYEEGMDIETADKYATMAGMWAEWGCYQALMS